MFWLFALPIATAAAEPSPLRINDIVMIGTHNSYKLAMPAERLAMLRKSDAKAADSLDYAHRPIAEQLDFGARQLEIDVWQHADGFKVQHVAGFDDRSNCATLIQCLTIVRDWSDAHPGHLPILLMFNAKEGARYTEAAFDALDHEIRSVLAASKLIVPDDVQGSYPTLREAVLANNWPTLAAARGKFIFALDEGPEKVAIYRGSRKSLEGRVFFVNTDEASPAAAYLTLNDPVADAEHIARAVKANFLVRTRADADTHEARANDVRRRDTALKSGAQYISTDYLWPDDRFTGGYRVTLPNGAVALCNPARRSSACEAITEPARR